MTVDLAPVPAWVQPVEDVFRSLGSTTTGLAQDEAAARLRRNGRNVIYEAPGASVVRELARQFESPLVLILVFAGLVAGVLREWLETAIILAMVVGTTLIGFAQEHRASRAVTKLRRRLALFAQVRRNGTLVDIPLADIVVGDVVQLSAGSLVPADGRVLSARDLLVSEAALTGESFPVEKQPAPLPADTALTRRTNCVFMGSSVRSGVAEIIVTATGSRSQFGALAERLRRKPEETDFSRGVRRFGMLLVRVVTVMVLAVLIINQVLGRPFINSLLFSVALGLGMSPELLPAIVSVTLSAGAARLARKGVIVRTLESIENLGGMSVLCTDKTGTLTEGRIRLVEWLDADGGASEEVRRLGFLNAAFETGITNPMDQALLADGEASGFESQTYSKIEEIPYDFSRKRLTVVLAPKNAPEDRLMILKGAFDNVLPLCVAVRHGQEERLLDADAAAAIRALYERKSRDGLRLLAVATRRLATTPPYGVREERQMCLEGFLVFHDPPKADAADAIERLRAMGVEVKVISGDNRHVVRHVADQLGILGGMITGGELQALKDEALWARVEKTALFAEIDPQQKERIVRALQKVGRSVGYLGDGINDAPALVAADVGVSVDQAVDVARESADVVLLERDLAVLGEGVLGGRRAFANTLKYICITSSANFGNMVSMALAAPLLPFLPLAAKQILLNNFLSDLPSMAIASDRVDQDSLLHAQRIEVADIQKFMIVFGAVSSIFDLLAFAIFLKAFHTPQLAFQTCWFVLSLLTELAVVMLLRTQGPAWRSRPGKVLAAATLVVACVALALPFAGPLAAIFDLAPVSAPLVGALLALAAAYLAATEIVKLRYFRHTTSARIAPPPKGA